MISIISMTSMQPQLNDIITTSFRIKPFIPDKLTIRTKYNPRTGKRDKIHPRDGLKIGIKNLKNSISKEFHLIPDKDFAVFTEEDECNRILHIVINCIDGKIEFTANLYTIQMTTRPIWTKIKIIRNNSKKLNNSDNGILIVGIMGNKYVVD